MHGDFVLVLVLVIGGCAALLFGVIYTFCQFFAWIGRGVWHVVAPRRARRAGGHWSRPRVCPNERCRKVEHRAAQYCSQCGTRLM